MQFSEALFLRVLWDPVCEDTNVVTLETSSFTLWKFTENCDNVKNPSVFDDLPRLTDGCWDPHHPSQLVTVNNKCIKTWDLRSSGT